MGHAPVPRDLSAAPNFAFELCASRIDEADLQGLDFRSLRFVANGAEPIAPQTLRRFTERFARYGFDPRRGRRATGWRRTASGSCFPPPDAAR